MKHTVVKENTSRIQLLCVSLLVRRILGTQRNGGTPAASFFITKPLLLAFEITTAFAATAIAAVGFSCQTKLLSTLSAKLLSPS
jgi:hypothetical protein